MSSYKVIWEIDVDADSPEEAAQESRKIQLDKDSEADLFKVAPSCDPSDVSYVRVVNPDSE